MPVFQWRKSGAINNRTLINRRCTFLNLSLTYVKRKKKEKKNPRFYTNEYKTLFYPVYGVIKEKKLNRL